MRSVMPMLGSQLAGVNLVALIAIIAAAFALMALRIIAADIDYARRWRQLREDARRLREQQMDRLRNLRPRRS